jgi:hypothetical protein
VIDCGNGNAGNVVVSGSGNSAITINTTAAATIVLRHLALNGLGTGAQAINIVSFFSGTLIVEDCMIPEFSSFGISFILSNGRVLPASVKFPGVQQQRLWNRGFTREWSDCFGDVEPG